MSSLFAQINVKLHQDSLGIAAQFPGASITTKMDRSREQMLVVNATQYTLNYYLATNGFAYECYVEPKSSEAALAQVAHIKETMPHEVGNVYVSERFIGLGNDLVLIIYEPKDNNRGYPHFLYRFLEAESEELIPDDDGRISTDTEHVIAVEEPDYDPNEALPIAVVTAPPRYGKCSADDANPTQCTFEAIQRHVAKKLKLPKDAFAKDTKGRVYVKLVIGQNGAVEEHTIMRGVNPAIDDAVLKAFASLGQFTPPLDRGRPCRVQMVIPVLIEP